MKKLLIALLLFVSTPVLADEECCLLPLFTVQTQKQVRKNHFRFLSFDQDWNRVLLNTLIINGYKNSVGAYPSAEYVNKLFAPKGWTDIVIPYNVDPKSFRGVCVHQLSKEQTEHVWKGLEGLKPILKPNLKFFFVMSNPKEKMFTHIWKGGHCSQVPNGFIKFGYLTGE